VLVLGETITLLGGIGILAVCGGVFLIAGGPRLFGGGDGASQPSGQAHARSHARALDGVRWGAATGALIACYTVIDGYAVKLLLIGPVLVDYVGNVLRVPLLALPVLRDREGFAGAARTQWKHALVVATLGPLAYILVLYAVKMAPLSHVAPAREVSMLFAALIGGRLLGEGDRALRLVGAAFIAAGVIALATA
jgi:drug/metabolite transporter (DMT)-like permease